MDISAPGEGCVSFGSKSASPPHEEVLTCLRRVEVRARGDWCYEPQYREMVQRRLAARSDD
jgi:hypothetical protein